MNDLESFKREALKIDPSVTELPFYSHAALLRLPLFARGSFTFLINFWSNEKNSFKEEDIEPLSRLIAPLAEELAAAFTDIPIAVGEVQERLTGYERIRQCAGLAALRQGIEKVAPTRTTVLVTGETGSGKELVAEAIHELSGRSGGPLVRVNCGSIAPTLLESELFGYEKGAFTGAQSRRSGYFECANGGTLFLDEIGELPLTAQVQLLRVLDRKIIQRVGDPRAIPVDVRVVAATNRDLEEMVEKAQRDVESMIREEGEAATLEVGVHGIHPELVKLLGKMKFRTSYGQNALKHSIEVAHLSGLLAAEMGLDVRIAKRAGLLHDIGKAVDHEMEGTHIQLGVDLCRKYKESAVVINAVEAHHGDVEPENLIACIVQAADAISAARPGARRETLETYTNRLKQLEDITNSVEGVDKSFAIQAGREIRVMVIPEKVTDADMVLMARDISKQIEAELEYPGQIKVNVVRESRAIDYAK